MRPIQVWSFYEAPEEYQALSPHGGDEDWIALVPREYVWIPYWVTQLGACETSEHTLSNGDFVCIAAHA